MKTSAVEPEQRLAHYRHMLGARLLEERLARLYGQGRIAGGVYLGTGQEALSAAAGMALRKGDHFAPLIRDQGGRVAFGESYEDTLRQHLGKRTAPQLGRDGNVHRGRLEEGLLPMVSHLGAMLGLVGGLLFADRRCGRPGTVGLAAIGEGGINAGASSEALNVLAIERLPMVLVVANNGFAYSTTNEYSFAVKDLQDRGRGFGWATHGCDGRDAVACLTTCSAAVVAARGGGGPQMVVADLMRLRGHGEHDDGCYMGDDRHTPAQDCLLRAEQALLQEGISSREQLDRIREEELAAIEQALQKVDSEADADPDHENWEVYSDRARLYAEEVV